MIGRLLGVAASALLASSASAQGMDHTMHGRSMPGMAMPPAPATKPPSRPKTSDRTQAKKRTAPTRAKRAAPTDASEARRVGVAPSSGSASRSDHPAALDMSAMPGMAMDGSATDHDMATMPGMAAAGTGTDLAPGNAPAPAPRADHLADEVWGTATMARSREDDLRREHGGMTYYQVLLNIAEYRAQKARDGYRWDGEAWLGGDIDRLSLKSEGRGYIGRSLGEGEVQALYSRALDPYWNLQAGVRQDFGRSSSRTYAAVGIEGLAPYWFEVEGALFLSQKGDLLARAEAWYDQRLTQFIVLQPRIEANISAQDVAATGTGAGLSEIEAGLRLRYDHSRRLGPSIGISWERQYGRTARYTRARGGDTGGVALVVGMRAWF